MASLWHSVKQWLGITPAPEESIASDLYHRAVLAARSPDWYVQSSVPDTLDGRFEMVLLHVFGLQERLGRAQPTTLALAVQRALSEAFFRDMDRSLRELGVADTGVGRRIKNMAEAYFGRIHAYQTARATRDSAAWQEALARNVYGKSPVGDVAWLAGTMEQWFTQLDQESDAELLKLPEPALTKNAA